MFRLQWIWLVMLFHHGFLWAQSDELNRDASIARGERIYGDHCLACHMQDGTGVIQLNPPLVKSKTVQGNKARLIRIILEGMNEPVMIDGVVYESPMPGLKYLSDQQIADVLTYIRASFGNAAGAIKPDDVTNERKPSK